MSSYLQQGVCISQEEGSNEELSEDKTVSGVEPIAACPGTVKNTHTCLNMFHTEQKN